MGTRRRRSIDAVLLGLAVALVGGAAVAGAVAAASERITGLWAGAQVAAGGAARIVEVIDYDFGSRRDATASSATCPGWTRPTRSRSPRPAPPPRSR